MSDEITVIRKDIEQLKSAVKTLMDESKSSKRELSGISQSIENIDKRLSDRVSSTTGKIDLDVLKKYITRDFITKLYRG